MNLLRRQSVFRFVVLLAITLLSACSTVGLNLPFDGAPVAPDGMRLKPTMGWLTTRKIVEPGTVPEGSVALKQVRINRRIVWQQVRRLKTDQGEFADSILLDRESLRPIETWRWTPQATYITRYNHRSVDREVRTAAGATSRWSEILEVEPYSALGIELLVSTLSLGDGETGLVPVAIDTAQRGWTWVRYTVMGEVNTVERPNAPSLGVWIIDLEMLGERTRIWVASDGRAVRRIEHLNADNEVLSLVRRMLLGGQ
jgi:hypothetical protein